ncbi:endospore germination permease [Clostridiaceae bacterium M8S5]|nr:endospore germination permease [Clostridiaceae bacterium M8S5]
MKKEIISDKQGIHLMILFIMGSTLVMGIGNKSGRDSWLSILIAMALVFPMLMIYAKTLSLYPGKDLYDIIEHVFGKVIGKIISISYIWFSLYLASLILRNFGEFIRTVSLPETPIIATMIGCGILAIWGVKSGIEMLGRWANLVSIVMITIVIMTLFFLLPMFHFNNLKPVLYNGFNPVLDGAFDVFTFPLAELVIFTLFFSAFGVRKSSYKIYSWGLLLGGLVVLVVTMSEILVLGEIEYKTVTFPAYSTIYKINIFHFIQRIEIIVSINLLAGGFIKCCMCLLGACNGIKKVFNYSDYKFCVIPVGLLMVNLSQLIYDDLEEMVDWAFYIWRYYASVFQVILPLIIFGGAIIKKRIESKKDNKVI